MQTREYIGWGGTLARADVKLPCFFRLLDRFGRHLRDWLRSALRLSLAWRWRSFRLAGILRRNQLGLE